MCGASKGRKRAPPIGGASGQFVDLAWWRRFIWICRSRHHLVAIVEWFIDNGKAHGPPPNHHLPNMHGGMRCQNVEQCMAHGWHSVSVAGVRQRLSKVVGAHLFQPFIEATLTVVQSIQQGRLVGICGGVIHLPLRHTPFTRLQSWLGSQPFAANKAARSSS
jgi:hypothetical protein